MKVFDLLDREVALLVDEEKTSGEYTVRFDAHNIASGVYIYRLHAIGTDLKASVEVKKLVLLR